MPRALAVDPRDARVLYLGSEQGLFRSTDGADNWVRVESPLNGRQIWSILLLPQDPDVILVGTCPSRLFRSADAGRTWTEPPVQIEPDCPRIIHTRVTTPQADPTAPGTVWAGIEIDGLRVSHDSGQTWQAMGEGLSSRDLHALVIVPAAQGQARRLLASTNNDLNVSDDGQTWRPLGLGRVLPWPYFRWPRSAMCRKWCCWATATPRPDR